MRASLAATPSLRRWGRSCLEFSEIASRMQRILGRETNAAKRVNELRSKQAFDQLYPCGKEELHNFVSKPSDYIADLIRFKEYMQAKETIASP